MAKEEFQENWRGSRKYQLDEETRRTRAALDRKLPDPAHLPQPNKPIQSTEAAAHLPKSRPRRRGLSIAKMLLFATVVSIAGYVTTLFFEGQQIFSPALAQTTGAQPQTSTPEPSLPSEVPLPRNRPDKYDPVGGVVTVDETKLILLAACALGLLGCYLLFRRISVAAKRRSEPIRLSSKHSGICFSPPPTGVRV
jgi:hypothetical protein